ncbi:hypothetical protein, partial [Streptomyces filamentosus]|uniref:hypothetical protein n=1 Tax=Streptomyces filamentosus TaxID=67294 RepID=UPI0033CCB636
MPILRGRALGGQQRLCAAASSTPPGPAAFRTAGVGDLLELGPRGGDGVLDGRTDLDGDGDRVARFGRPGPPRGNRPAYQDLGLPPVVARLAQPGRPLPAAVRARHGLDTVADTNAYGDDQDQFGQRLSSLTRLPAAAGDQLHPGHQ